MLIIILSVRRAPPLAWLLYPRLTYEGRILAGDGSEADFDLGAALEALDYIEDEAELRSIAEALAKAIGPSDNPAAKQHVANLTRAAAQSRLSSSRFL
jgi:hypothetical protein